MFGRNRRRTAKWRQELQAVDPSANGSHLGEGGQERCEAVALLAILSGQPSTPEGQEILRRHTSDCSRCYRRGWGSAYIDTYLERTPEAKAGMEAIFGPINWIGPD